MSWGGRILFVSRFSEQRHSENGAALPVVMVLLLIGGLSGYLLLRTAGKDESQVQSTYHRLQALYLAESGLAWELEKLALDEEDEVEKSESSSETAKASNLGIPSLPDDHLFGFSGASYLEPPWPQLSLAPDLAEPSIKTLRTKTYWEIRSTGKYRDESVTVTAQFGEALDERLFSPALTLENEIAFEKPPPNRIEGDIQVKMPAESDGGFLPWDESLQPSSALTTFAEKKYRAASADLRRDLNLEGSASGNAFISAGRIPDFKQAPTAAYPFGDVEIQGGAFSPLILKGPGRISANGDIRIRGNVVLEDLELSAGRDIILEDSVHSQSLSLFAERNLNISDRCSLLVQAMAGGALRLRGNAALHPRSLLLTIGKLDGGGAPQTGKTSQPPSMHLEDNSRPRGFILAAGTDASIHLSRGVILEGVLYSAGAVQIEGEVRGPVVARSLPCAANEAVNCLGQGRIRRFMAPADLVQPPGLAAPEEGKRKFQLLFWRQSRE